MSEKFKKIERQYVLSDSSVNEYGFRLLTSGYEIASFQKNPIGYYMHRREEGIVLKWEDLHIADDKVIGTPVINLRNARGVQTCDEAENGFLNAASVGHIVVLEYSMDKELMLPGQTGPTITRWYNKECSLVDIPGNSNALTKLYDINENELNLSGLNLRHGTDLPAATAKDICAALKLPEETTYTDLSGAVKGLAAKQLILEAENAILQADKKLLHTQLDELLDAGNKNNIAAMLDRALEDKKITTELKIKLATDYAHNPEGLKLLLRAMPAYLSIAEQLKSHKRDEQEAQWTWDDYERNDPSGNKLKALRATDAPKYKELFDKKFAA
jgi:hypothetical protein